MKTTIIPITLLALAAVGSTGCAVRTAEFYRDDVQKVLESKTSDIKTCYDAALVADKKIAGTVQVRFMVAEETGAIKDPKVQGEAPQPLQECVTKSLEGLVLTPPDNNPGDGTFTWEFSVGEPKKG